MNDGFPSKYLCNNWLILADGAIGCKKSKNHTGKHNNFSVHGEWSDTEGVYCNSEQELMDAMDEAGIGSLDEDEEGDEL